MPNTGPILRVLTWPLEAPDAIIPQVEHVPGSYTCECARCQADIVSAVVRGVRGSKPLPIKKAA